MVACERCPDSLVELIESFPHLEWAFHAYGTYISALQYVEVHDLFLPSRKIALHLDHYFRTTFSEFIPQREVVKRRFTPGALCRIWQISRWKPGL
jgi:hypothetical protein